MDIISYGKAKQVEKNVKSLDKSIIGIHAESHFETVDHRIDRIEKQAENVGVQSIKIIDLSLGNFNNVELVNNYIKLKFVERK